jgi:hypothetical protein
MYYNKYRIKRNVILMIVIITAISMSILAVDAINVKHLEKPVESKIYIDMDPLYIDGPDPNLISPLPPKYTINIAGALPGHWVMIPTYKDVPEYTWHYGCSPTAAGMLFGWWDAQPGTGNLYLGDASTFDGDSSESMSGGTRAMVASTSHIVAGMENGYTHGDWHNCPSIPNHEINPMSLADFMKTVDGGTSRANMAAGFENFAAWDCPWALYDQSYTADATTYYTDEGWTFTDFKNEIDKGYPVHLGITGHSVLALGYWDLRNPMDPGNFGYICWTTWSGWGLQEWRWDGVGVPDGRAVYGATYLRIKPANKFFPSADAGGPYVVNEGSTIYFDAGKSKDLDGDILQYRWDFDNNGIYDTSWSTNPKTSRTWYDDYSGTVKVQVTDGTYIASATASVLVKNVPPKANFNNNGPKNEGSSVTFSFSYVSDPGIYDTFSYSFDWNNDGIYEIKDQKAPSASHAWCDNGYYTVRGMIKDDDGGYNVYTSKVTIYNVAPKITNFYVDQPNPQFILPMVHTLTFTGTFSDPGWCDYHTARIDFGDGKYAYPSVSEEHYFPYSTGKMQVKHKYAYPGNYIVTLTFRDDDYGSTSKSVNIRVVDEFEALGHLNFYIQTLPNYVFKGNAMQIKHIVSNQIMGLMYELRMNDYRETPVYLDVIDTLNCVIRIRADGYVDGCMKNDLIMDPTAQYHICMKIDDITAYLQYLCCGGW